MPTMKVNLYDAEIYWDDENPPNPKWAIIGVLKEEWRDGMANTYLDSRTIFWFDSDEEILALKKGDKFGDFVLHSIDYTPDYREEDYSYSEYDEEYAHG
jgi:hypothetical protein